MRGFLQWLQQNLGIVMFLLAFGLPVLGKVWEALRKQSIKQKQQRERIRAEIDAMRTGQPIPSQVSTEPTAADRRAQAKAQRERQLEDLRRRAKEREEQRRARQQQRRPQPVPMQTGQVRVPPSAPQQTPPTGQPVPPPPRRTQQIRLPGGIVLEVPVELDPQAEREAEQRRAEQQRRRQQRARQQQERDRENQARRPAAIDPTPLTGPGSLAAAPDIIKAPKSPSQSDKEVKIRIMGKTMTREDWRRAIVMREIFDKPISMRDDAAA